MLFIRKMQDFPKSSRLLLTSHCLEMCYMGSRDLSVVCHISAALFHASVLGSAVWATSDQFPMVTLCFSALGISLKLWKILGDLQAMGQKD